MTTPMPGDPRVLQRRVYVTFAVTGALAVVASIVGVLGDLRWYT